MTVKHDMVSTEDYEVHTYERGDIFVSITKREDSISMYMTIDGMVTIDVTLFPTDARDLRNVLAYVLADGSLTPRSLI